MPSEKQEDNVGGADGDAALVVVAVEAALTDLRRRCNDALIPLETVQELLLRQAAHRLLECSEQIETEGLTVEGSKGQIRPHPLLDRERAPRREIVEQLKKRDWFAGNRARVERLNERTRKPRAPGLTEPITLAVDLGESAKDVDDLLAARDREQSRTADARELILEILQAEREQESDTLDDARVAGKTGLAAKAIKNIRATLVKEGLVKAAPVKDELGTILRWRVHRSGARR
jgi:predicted transcriptional regulator